VRSNAKRLRRSRFIDSAQIGEKLERKPGAVALQRLPVISGVFQNSGQASAESGCFWQNTFREGMSMAAVSRIQANNAS